jgi:hypothetical protein
MFSRAERHKMIFLAAFCCMTSVCAAQTDNGKDAILLKGRILIEGSNEDIPYTTLSCSDTTKKRRKCDSKFRTQDSN